jgi:GNAT superfamily N-acetyltransferase
MNPTAPETRIDRATSDYAAELLTLQRLCFREEAEFYGEPDITPLTQTLHGLLEDFRTQIVLGAWTGMRLIGSVRARCEQGVCKIGRLVVHPDHRRNGLGTALMAAIEQIFPDAAIFELFTGERSERNLRLYHRLGYAPAGREVVSPRLALVLLRKPGRTPVSGTSPNPDQCRRPSPAPPGAGY